MKMPEWLIRRVLFLTAFSSLAILALIALFILKEGFPVLTSVGPGRFLLGKTWLPGNNLYGILPFIIGSLWVTAGALAIGVPLGLACAICLVEFVPRTVSRFLKPTIELLAGIPSVVYGFIGVVILTPWIRSTFGGPGFSLLAGALVLGVMILPTIISISMDAFQALPPSYREGSIALGATRWQTVHLVLLPGARSGILAAVILGMGRAVGETMAVIMVAGNAVKMPRTILDPARTLTSNIALEMSYAMGMHRHALFATAVVLLFFVLVLNVIAGFLIRRAND